MEPIANPPNEVPDSMVWYCLRAQPKHERIAAIHLRKRMAIEVFAPQIRFCRAQLDRKVWRTEALFPSYLFARFNLIGQWRAVQYCHAVRGIVHFGNKYVAVPTTVVEQLRELVGPNELAVADGNSLRPGQEIVVAEGPFRGVRTIVTRYLPPKERVHVLMRLLGQEMEVEMSVGAVAPTQHVHPLITKLDLLENLVSDGTLPGK